MGTGPMYCPYGGGLCQHAAIERCGMQLSNLIECKVFWEREHASEQFDEGPQKPPSPPAEMPEVDIDPFEAKSTFQPIVTIPCPKWHQAIGKKPANSCVGCTVPGCKAKGHIEEKRD